MDGERRQVPGLTKVLSAADAIDAAAGAELLPAIARDVAVRFAWDGMRKTIPAFAEALHAPHFAQRDQWLLRIMLRARERQPAAEKLRLIDQVRRVVAEELARSEWDEWRTPATTPGAEQLNQGLVTGYFVLLTHLIESIVRDQWVSFGLASLGVGLCLLAALRDVRLALLALVPNALPVLLVLGLIGWLDVKMNLGAAMIAAVSMGLTVDGSLHYLVGYRSHRKAGKSVHASLLRVQSGVGRAMLLSTVALILGFSVLCTSPFVPTVTFGWLMSLAMFGGLLGNLYVLPLLVTITERRAR
jgi:predicted RND superfamily exporter protein